MSGDHLERAESMKWAVCGVLIHGASAFIVQVPLPSRSSAIGADIALAVGVLRHGADDEAVLDAVEHDLVVVDADAT